MKQIVVDVNGTPYEFDSISDACPLSARQIVAQRIYPEYTMTQAKHKVLVSPDCDLFNPIIPGISMTKKVVRHGINKYFYNLRRCSEGCYKDYVAFLRSKNRTNLVLAQRRFYDESGAS